MRTLLAVAGLLFLTGVVAAALSESEGRPAGATGPSPSMALAAPDQAPVGQAFEVTVSAAAASNVVGFSAEVLFPAGTEWLQRTACANEVQVTIGGVPPPFCFRAAGPAGEARYFVLSTVFPPFPALDTPLNHLLELDVRCVSPGAKTLVLTAVPDSPYGAVYFDMLNNQVTVKTLVYDVDGDTTPESVAATHTIDCLAEPTWTSTAQATSTLTSTPTLAATATSTPDPDLSDADGDGCSDIRELSGNAAMGGMRNPDDFWDFYDVPARAPLARDRSVSSLDIFAVIGRFNSSGDSGIDPLSTPPPSGYHTAFDRGAVTGPNVWNLGPANGSVAATDIFAVIGQFNHTCA